ncbi:MAG: hypothetical protein JOS17DRAFT_794728 [Linnemannia elongata]|nr:MAG: hypothetical protein JOS17DRAFT_794728 [Linnemannia elongata]
MSSAVRQNIYIQFKEKNLLPASDDVPLPFSAVCLVGQANGSDKKLAVSDLINWMPKELTSKATLDEKAFETWYHGRAVLIDDGGSGTNCAIYDAVALANSICALPEIRTGADVDQAFKACRVESLPCVEEAFNSSPMMKSMVQKAAFLPLIESQGDW